MTTKFTNEAAAIEEAEFLANETGVVYSVVITGNYMEVITKEQALSRHKFILETVKPSRDIK